MTSSSPDARHVMHALGDLMTESRALLVERGEPGLRPSHHRVIGHVPAEGTTVTDLADRVGMSKQGIGQFVAQLTESGHLVVERDADDRRVRVVRRTPKGDRSVLGLAALLDELEGSWAGRVGSTRYREFRRTLEEIALS